MKTKLFVILAFLFGSFAVSAQQECLDPSWPNSIVLDSEADGMVTIYPSSGLLSQSFYFPGTNTACLETGCSAWFIDNFSGEPMVLTYTINGVSNVMEIPAFMSDQLSINFGGGESGCTDAVACNYNPNATCYDGSCIYNCYGCTDPSALNFDTTASVDDGTCCYNENTFFSVVASGPVYVTGSSSDDGSWNSGYYPNEAGFCLEGDCIEIQVVSLDGSAVSFTVTHTATGISYSGTTEGGLQSYGYLSLTGTTGCADPQSCNYDPNATCPNYYVCDYSCIGCTDPTAANFDENATVDNGSCCYSENWSTLTLNVPAFFNIYATDGSYYYAGYTSELLDDSFCLPDGCFNIEVYPTIAEYSTIEASLVGANGTVYYTFNAAASLLMDSFSKNAVAGCVDPGACNFDPNANCGTSLLCDYGCYGCTDANADNYDANATIDDGTCCYGQYTIVSDAPILWNAYSYTQYWNGYYGETPNSSAFCPQNGCYVFYAYSYDGSQVPFAVFDDEGNAVVTAITNDLIYQGYTFEVNAISGCMDPAACNFDPEANCYAWDACDYSCYGCTNAEAPNFDPTATIDDGSCCLNNWFTLNIDGSAYFWAQSYATGESAGGNTPFQNGFCMQSGCFDFTIFSNGPGGLDFTLTDQTGSVVLSGNTFTDGGYFSVSNNEVYGCTDAQACNYDPAATCSSWYACDYSCYGCTDSAAPNFDPTATIDDGTCCTDNWYTFNSSGTFYWSVVDNENGGYAWGVYPGQNGFCNSGTCISLQVWDIYGGTVDYTLTNSSGQVVFSGSSLTSWFLSTPISFDNEIPGCTDSNACNYDPNATCEAGNCDYYCGGCTDFTALNYNSNALWNDGSCVFSIEPPQIAVSTEESPFSPDEYFVRINVVSTGNGAPYLASSDLSSEAMMINESGNYVMGPFPCNENAIVNMHSAALGMSTYNVSDPVTSPCNATVGTDDITEEISQVVVYPNPTNGNITIAGLNENVTVIRLYDYTGREVAQWAGQQWNNTTTFDLSDFSNGFYQIQIQSNDGIETKSLVIKK